MTFCAAPQSVCWITGLFLSVMTFAHVKPGSNKVSFTVQSLCVVHSALLEFK